MAHVYATEQSIHRLDHNHAQEAGVMLRAQAFGDITAVPTMFLFDKSGKTARVMYGAPPNLHQQAEKVLDELIR